MSHHLLPMLAWGGGGGHHAPPPTADPTDGLLVGAQGVGFLLTLLGIIVSVALTIKGQQAYIGRLKRDRARIIAEADAREQQIVAEAAAREQQIVAEAAAREDQFRTYIGAIDAVTRQKAANHLTQSRPAENPPPGIMSTIRALVSYDVAAEDPFIFPVGWKQLPNRPPSTIGYSLWPASDYFSGHIAISGETRYGKGNLAFLILATLCLRLTTAQLQVFAIDPKRDFALWRGLAHNWREPVLGRDPATIQAAMTALRAERERREALRERCRALEHVQIPEQIRPPMLVVYLAELDVLQLGTDDLDEWMASEMSTSLAAGIIYIVDAQNNSGRATRWRTHFGTFLAGFQASESSVQPNIGMRVDEIEKLGAIPPHKLPGRGYFTARNGREVLSVRTPLISLEDRKEALDRMPKAVSPRSITPPPPAQTPEAGETSGGKSSGPKLTVSPEERAKILAEAPRHASRGDLTAAVFGGRRTGEPAQKVKIVCDEAGLLMPNADRMLREAAEPA